MDVSEPDSGAVEVEKKVGSEASEAVAVEKEAESSVSAPESLDAELSVPPSSNAAVGGGGAPAQVYEVPRCGEDQPSTRASWMNCCGLLDAVRGSNQ